MMTAVIIFCSLCLLGVGVTSFLDWRREVAFQRFLADRKRRRESSDPRGYWEGME